MPQSNTVGDLLKSLTEKSDSATTLLYQSYLLRLWRDSASGPWRATLEQVATGKTYAFAQLENLITFLNDPLQPTVTANLTGEAAVSAEESLPDTDIAGHTGASDS